MGWFGKRKAREHAEDLLSAVKSEQPKQADAHEDAPSWVARLLWLAARLWPNPVLQIILAILEAALKRLSTEDRAEAEFGLNRYRRAVGHYPEKIAAALEVK